MISADLIIPNLAATSKKQAFRVMAEEISEILPAVHPDALLNALMERERIGSTGIGQGVAIPHIKVEGVQKMYCILARLSSPVDYDAIDGKPVDIVFLLLASAESKTTQHLKMLAHISRFLKDGKICDALRASDSVEKIKVIMQDWIKKQAAA